MHKEEYRVIERFDLDGRLLERVWSRPNSAAPHRLGDQPASEAFDTANGRRERAVWCDQRRGGRHRDGNHPAYVEVDTATGTVVLEEYYIDGLIQRSDGGASRIIRDGHSGATITEEFHVAGALHRDFDLPAVMQFNPATGFVIHLRYYRDGELHRESGPAVVDFDEHGRAVLEVYYQWGIRMSDPNAGPTNCP